MIAFAYIIPIIACLILHFQFNFEGEWTYYLYIFLGGEAFVGFLHYFFLKHYTSDEEYLGSLVSSIHYEAPWTEVIVRYETRTDSKGRSYTVKKVDYVYHPEKYYFFTSIGSRILTNKDFFGRVRDTWRLERRNDTWVGGHIRGGIRYGHHYDAADLPDIEKTNPENWIAITEPNAYKNKIRRSNSIFKFEEISRQKATEMGLYDYPAIEEYDSPCILSTQIPISEEIDLLFRKFNARYASLIEMRMYILIFPADKGVGISEMQRAYWEGGNKNEFVICIGMDPEERIRWAKTFSWADEQTVEIETEQWLMRHPHLDWQQFHNWLIGHIVNWKRKEFKDFDYIQVSLPIGYFITILLLSILENAAALYFVVTRIAVYNN